MEFTMAELEFLDGVGIKYEEFIILHDKTDILYVRKPATKKTIYSYDGFDQAKTREFANRLEIFQNPEVFKNPEILNISIQDCLSSINDPEVDVNAFYHGRDWFNPRSCHPLRETHPISFFAAAVVTAPLPVIEAMMAREDTDINVHTSGPEAGAEPFGMLTSHIAFRDKRDGRDPERDGLHPDTVGVFRALFSDPNFDTNISSFMYEDNAFADLRARGKAYFSIVAKAYDERDTILAEPNKENIRAALATAPEAIMDEARSFVLEDHNDNPEQLTVADRARIYEAGFELAGVIGDSVDAWFGAPEREKTNLDRAKLIQWADEHKPLGVARMVAESLFVLALREVCKKKWGPDQINYDGSPRFVSPQYRAASRIGDRKIYAHFGQLIYDKYHM